MNIKISIDQFKEKLAKIGIPHEFREVRKDGAMKLDLNKLEQSFRGIGLAMVGLTTPIPKWHIDCETDYMQLYYQMEQLGIQNDERLLSLKQYAKKLSETTFLTYRQAFNYIYTKLRRAIMAGDFTPNQIDTEGLKHRINAYQIRGVLWSDAVFMAFRDEAIPWD